MDTARLSVALTTTGLAVLGGILTLAEDFSARIEAVGVEVEREVTGDGLGVGLMDGGEEDTGDLEEGGVAEVEERGQSGVLEEDEVSDADFLWSPSSSTAW